MKRDPNLQVSVEAVRMKLFGRSEETHPNNCVTCGSPQVNPEDFKDELSRKDFAITRMCQVCQDSIYSDEQEK